MMCFVSAANVSAQTVTGVVTDFETKTPVVGVLVLVDGTNNAISTDIDGKYSINKVKEGDILKFSFFGYETQSVKYTGQAAVNVELKVDGIAIEEIVVVGFGSQKKENLTGSVAVVDKAALESRPVSNVVDMLQGAVPGLNISNSAGTGIDASASINIRGTGTIGAGSSGAPLVLIDGMEGDFNSLNPQDIKSISVLKDAASSSIYGSRAPFGVILITTKKGSDGKLAISYNNSFRFSTPRNVPKMMDSYTFAHYFNDAAINAGQAAWFSDERIADIQKYANGELPYGQYISDTNPNFWGDGFAHGIGSTDHYEEAYKDWSFSQEHNMSIQGGTEKVNYYISSNFSDNSGFIKVNPDNVTRLTTTAKVNAKLYDWLSVNYTSRFSNQEFNYPTALGVQRFAWGGGLKFFYELPIWPTSPDYDPNGNPYSSINREQGTAVFSLSQGGDTKKDLKNYFQQIQIVLEPIKNWKTFLDYNYRFGNTAITTQVKKSYNVGVDNTTLYPVGTDSYVQEYRANSVYNNFNAYSEYQTTLNDKHFFKAMVGFQTELNDAGNVQLRRDGLMVDDLISINTTDGTSSTGDIVAPIVSGAYSDWVTAGFFGRLNYSYDNKYLFEANIRYDGTSRFRGDSRWGLFPSGSVGWNIANEDFFEPLRSTIGSLKLRASYGQLGNQNTSSLYPTYRTMNINTASGKYLINGVKPTVVTEPGLIDPYLTWERIINYNVGLDLSAFNNRLNINADFFIRDTKDMVGPAPEMPAYFGAAVPKQNNTDLRTAGYEIGISWRDSFDNDFSYGFSASLSDSETTILSYPNPNGLLSDYNEGRVLGEIWGYETIGIAKTQEEMDAHLATTNQSNIGGNWAAGDIMYKDLNGDGKISNGANTLDDSGDLRVIGNNTPHYAVSFSANAAYKGFDCSFFFQGVLQRDYWTTDRYFWGVYTNIWASQGLTQHEDYFRADANHPLGQNLDSYYPRPLFADAKHKNQQCQTRYLQDAAYLRLKNVQVGYSFPQSLINQIGLQKCRVYVSGENLVTFTKLPDIYDPETISGGYYGSAYPQAATISFGVNVTF